MSKQEELNDLIGILGTISQRKDKAFRMMKAIALIVIIALGMLNYKYYKLNQQSELQQELIFQQKLKIKSLEFRYHKAICFGVGAISGVDPETIMLELYSKQ